MLEFEGANSGLRVAHGPDLSKVVLENDHPGHERIGCGSCGDTKPPGSRAGSGARTTRKQWLALETALKAHGGVLISEPFPQEHDVSDADDL